MLKFTVLLATLVSFHWGTSRAAYSEPFFPQNVNFPQGGSAQLQVQPSTMHLQMHQGLQSPQGQSGPMMGSSSNLQAVAIPIAQNRDAPVQQQQGYSVGSEPEPQGGSYTGMVSGAYGAPSGGYMGGGGGGGGGGYGGAAAGGQAFHYQMIPMSGGGGGGWGGGEDYYEEDESGGGGGHELVCAAALLGVKGLKGLKGVKGVKAVKAALKIIKGVKVVKGFALKLLVPLLIPLAIIKFLLLLVAILFIPVPIITPAPAPPGRSGKDLGLDSAARSVGDAGVLLDLAKDALSSRDCVERVSCEISRMARSINADGILNMAVERISGGGNKWGERIKTGANWTKSTPECSKFQCDPMAKIRGDLEGVLDEPLTNSSFSSTTSSATSTTESTPSTQEGPSSTASSSTSSVYQAKMRIKNKWLAKNRKKHFSPHYVHSLTSYKASNASDITASDATKHDN